ncbi:MAG: RHS repeat protein, partial [Actinobacteria bacterium]|nr:RHS repeat protein [Actinomycetota bacterium]
MFLIQNPVVFDKNKNNGPVSFEIKDNQAILTVSQDFLDKAAYPVTIDPTVIADNSSDMYSTAFSNQRKIFNDGTNYWAFYVKKDGLIDNKVFYEYSSDGINWSGTPQAITDAKVTSGYQFSLWQNGNTVYVALLHNSSFFDKSSIKVKKGTISSTSITWDPSWSTALSGTSPTTNYYAYPSITQDSSGKIWVTARYSNGTKYWIKARRSLNPNSVSTWESAIYNLSDTSNTSDVVFPGIIPLSNNRVYAFWYRYNTIEGKLFDGTDWDSATTNIATTWTENAGGIPSGTIDNNDKIYLAYPKETEPYNLVYKTSIFPYNLWSEPIELASDGQLYPSLTLDSSTNNIYAFYQQYLGNSQSIVKVKQLGNNSSKTLSKSSERFFDGVAVYNAPTDNFEWLIEQAANDTEADVKRTDTQKMISSTDDYLFVGMTEQFDSIFFNLSTLAQGLNLEIYYYNGTDFVLLPSYTDNTNNLSISLRDITFSPPSDWQASDSVYWIVIGTSTNPTIAPVGTQVTALKNNLFVSSNYKSNNKVFAFWTEGTTSNYRIKIGDVDNIAPITTLTTTPATPNGQNDWYISNPTITLASDKSGITYYSWTSASGPWTTYLTPFNPPEGQNNLYYYSADTAGNNEMVKSQLFKVDTGLPSISEQTPTPNTTVNTYTPTISARLTDSSSAIDPSTIVMKLDDQPVSHSYDLVTGIVSFAPPSDLTKGKHYVDLSVKDNAGNLSTSSWHFTVFGTVISDHVLTNTTWTKDGSPYIISPNYALYHDTFTINLGATLTIEPGVIVKIEAPEVHINIEGTLIAEGIADNKIVFTSIADDSYGGDTNNNGFTPITNLEHWDHIRLSASSRLNHTIVKYGGGVDFGIGVDRYNNGALYINDGSPTITNSLISDNMNYGIKIAGSATPIITNNTIINTILDPGWWSFVEGVGVYAIESASPTINYNNISNSDSYEIYSESSNIVNAQYNWWGTGTNPSGKIYGNVDQDPWALSPYTGTGGGTDPQGRYGSDTPCGYFGEPVNTATGNYTYEHEDINIPGKGSPIQIVRSYNSQDTIYNGSLGFGWTHNYNTNLRFNSDESITLMKANSQRYTFTKNSDGTYATPEGTFETLNKNADNTYTLKFKDQSKYNFNSNGFLASRIDKYDNQTTLTYNANNLLITVTDSGGRTITFTYTNNQITKIQDQTGRNIQYSYDANGNLTTVTDMNNKTTTFTYDSNHQLLTIQEPEPSANPFLTNHYDASGKVDWQKDAFLATTSFAYDTVNRKTTLTDNKGKQTIHEFDDRYRLTKSTDPLLNSVVSAYTTLDLPDSVTNQNNKTTNFTYDTNGNTISTKDPLNHEITASYDLTNNNLLWTKDALLNQTTYNY